MGSREELESKLTEELQLAMDGLRNANGDPTAREKALNDLREALSRFKKHILGMQTPDDLT